MSDHFRTEADLRGTPSSTSSASEYFSKIAADGRYASTRNSHMEQKKSMQKYFPAASREKNPSYSKIKSLQSKASMGVHVPMIRSQELEPGMLRSLPSYEDRRTDKHSDRGASSPKHHSNMLINGKEMSTARLISRIHQNLQSLEGMIEGLFSEQQAG